MVNQAFADTKNTIDEGYIQMGHDNEGSFIKFNNLPLSSPLKYFTGISSLDLINESGILTGLTDEGKKEEDILIPDGVKEITNQACEDATTIRNLILSDTIERIGFRAFGTWDDKITDNYKMEFLKLPKNNCVIGDEAFVKIKSIKKIDFYEGLIKVGESSFSAISNLTGDIVLPSTLLEVSNYLFWNWDNPHNESKVKSLTTKARKFGYQFFYNRHNANIYFEAQSLNEDDISPDALNNTTGCKFYFKNDRVRQMFIKKCVTSGRYKPTQEQFLLM